MFTNKGGYFYTSILLVFLFSSEGVYFANSLVPKDGILRGKVVPLRNSSKIFGNYFLDIFDKHIDLPAIIEADTGTEITYRQLKDNGIKFAAWLREKNVKTHDVMAVITDIRVDDYIPIISAFFEGITYSPWPTDLTLEATRHYLSISRPKVVVFVKSVEDILKRACKLENQTPILISWDSVNQNDSHIYSLKYSMASVSDDQIRNYKSKELKSLNEPAMIFFTSGSTGLPKGAVHSYNSVLNNIIHEFPINYPNQKGRPTILFYSTPSWISWSFYFVTCLSEGGVRIFHRQFNPVDTVQVVDKYNVNFFFLNPVEIAYLVQSGVLKDNHMQSVEDFSTGGSVVTPKFFEALKRSIGPNSILRGCYGLSETGHLVTCMYGHKLRKNVTADPIGFARPNVELKIVDLDSGRTLGPYETGEIALRRPYMFLGYYGNPEETRKVIDNEGWLHSGDTGYYDENGEIFFVDRMKDMMKFQNHQVTPSEIETVLRKHPSILEAAVVPVPDMIDGEHPMAFVVKRPGSKVTAEELIQLSASLGYYKKLWGGVQFLESLPRTPSKKVDKVKMKKMAKHYEKQYN